MTGETSPALSVPSMRVETLQPWDETRLVNHREAFSTLHAGRDAATRSDLLHAYLCSTLSVPSMRVETLQHGLNHQRHHRDVSFSTLHAGRDAATAGFEFYSWMSHLFQYPPCGSRRCNRRGGRRQPDQHAFQYPPCGSRRCNHAGLAANNDGQGLSVPSMRVETLQRISRSAQYTARRTFSTLHAGRDAATSPRTVKAAAVLALSVPSMRVETLQLPG